MLYPQSSLTQFLSLVCRKFIKYIPFHESQPYKFSSSVSFAFFSIVFFSLFVCFFEIKNMYSDTHLTMRVGEVLKNFHPPDFRKQDYFFWPEYNVWNQHWIGNYLVQGSPNTLIYFKSKSFFYLVRDFSNIFFFLKHDLKIIRQSSTSALFYSQNSYHFKFTLYGSMLKWYLLKESLPIFKSGE